MPDTFMPVLWPRLTDVRGASSSKVLYLTVLLWATEHCPAEGCEEAAQGKRQETTPRAWQDSAMPSARYFSTGRRFPLVLQVGLESPALKCTLVLRAVCGGSQAAARSSGRLRGTRGSRPHSAPSPSLFGLELCGCEPPPLL